MLMFMLLCDFDANTLLADADGVLVSDTDFMSSTATVIHSYIISLK